MKKSKRINPFIALILALSAMPASAGVCSNQSVYTTYTGTSDGGTYTSTGAYAGPYKFAGRYSFSPSTANTTTGTVTVSGVVEEGMSVRYPVSSLGGSYTVNAASCYMTVTYTLNSGTTATWGTVTATFYLGKLTNPVAPAANLAYSLNGIEQAKPGIYTWQWTTALERIYK